MVSYLAMALAGLLVSLAFKALGWVPVRRAFDFADAAPSWNYTTVLNIVFLALVLLLVLRFLRTGGVRMLRMMSSAPGAHEAEMSEAHSH